MDAPVTARIHTCMHGCMDPPTHDGNRTQQSLLFRMLLIRFSFGFAITVPIMILFRILSVG